jgi:hypothetical protein
MSKDAISTPYADNAPARMPEFARELTQLKPTVFKEESSTLPRFRQLIEGLLSSREATAISLDDQLGPRRLLSLGSRRHVWLGSSRHELHGR